MNSVFHALTTVNLLLLHPLHAVKKSLNGSHKKNE